MVAASNKLGSLMNLKANDRKTIFFDRDGTLNIDKVYLNDPEQIEYLPGVFEALALLRDEGFQFVVVTNQSGVARGIVSLENLNEIHARMANEFARNGIFFAGFYYAPFSVESNHPLRKPNPGMLQQAGSEHGVEFSKSWMVGDRMTDVEAGYRAGCRTVLLEGTDLPEQSSFKAPTLVVSGILEAAQGILEYEKQLALKQG
jgi:D-glycero-D-manno-heptose 1,7-bisphosphate phosphatase